MKKIILYAISFALMLISACSDDSNGTITGPGGIGGGGTGGGGTTGGTVNFTIGNQILQEGYDFDQDGQTDDSFYLTAKPSVSVKITKVLIGIPSNANFDVVEGDGTTVYNATDEVQINTTPYYNVGKGQQFTLKFTGKLASNDQAFDVTIEYTVP